MMQVTCLSALALLFGVGFGSERISKTRYNASSAIPASNSISFTKLIGLKDVQVSVTFDHDSIGELQISLTHEESQRTVKLFDRQCGSVGSDSLYVEFSDDTSNVLNCGDATSGELGVVPPSEALSLFDGLSGDRHTFTLSIDDLTAPDTGKLISWRVSLNVDKYLALNVLTSTFDAARQKCWDDYGTDLAVIHSTEDIAESKSLCEERCNALGSACRGCWIGLTDSATEGTFLWIDDSDFSLPGRRTDWNSNEPNDHGENGEDCVEISKSGNYKWNDMACVLGSHVPLCRSPSLQDFVALTTASSSWSNARTMCQEELQKDLAVYQWEGHMYEGKQICREVCDRISWCQGCWIGKSDTATEGTFEWYDQYLMDGEPLSSSDWKCNQTSNTGGNEDCAATGRYIDYKWSDLPCDASARIPLCYKYIPINSQ